MALYGYDTDWRANWFNENVSLGPFTVEFTLNDDTSKEKFRRDRILKQRRKRGVGNCITELCEIITEE